MRTSNRAASDLASAAAASASFSRSSGSTVATLSNRFFSFSAWERGLDAPARAAGGDDAYARADAPATSRGCVKAKPRAADTGADTTRDERLRLLGFGLRRVDRRPDRRHGPLRLARPRGRRADRRADGRERPRRDRGSPRDPQARARARPLAGDARDRPRALGRAAARAAPRRRPRPRARGAGRADL